MNSILQQLPGFLKLDKNQQDIILNTLAIQQQADNANPEAMQLVNEWFCHASALAVECGNFNSDFLTNIPKDYQNCEGLSLLICPNLQAFQKFLDEFEAPFVLHMLIQYPKDYIVYHSLISLGKFEEMHYVWEKRAIEKPFMITSAKELFDTFPEYGWGKRHFVYDSIQKILK